MLKVKVKKLHELATLPVFATEGAAAADLYAVEAEVPKHPNMGITFKTGIAMAIPEGYVGKIYMRSSVYKTVSRQSNAVGIIDSDYRGEIVVKHDISTELLAQVLEGLSRSREVYTAGERIAQIIIEKVPEVTYEEVDELDETKRGSGGFGSTGKNQLEVPFPKED